MDDLDIVHRISALSDEEHILERSHSGESLSDDGVARRARSRSPSTSAGTSSDSDEHDAPPVLTPMRQWRARRALSRATNSDRLA